VGATIHTIEEYLPYRAGSVRPSHEWRQEEIAGKTIHELDFGEAVNTL
jgi:hypothetical protein